MPLQIPGLDDLNYERLLEEAKRRIPGFTPEWTNFGIDSDPGITLVQLFAFLTDALTYRANRIPDRNRLKFLQLLGIPLQPAAPAKGVVTIGNLRGPLEALPLNPGVVMTAGNIEFLTSDGVTVLPIEAQVYYKQSIKLSDPNYANYLSSYNAVQLANQIQAGGSGTGTAANTVSLMFYETKAMTMPTAANPNPVLDFANTLDNAVYIALLAPIGVNTADGVQTVREKIANQILSIGIAPVLSGAVDPLKPQRFGAALTPYQNLSYQLPGNAGVDPNVAQYIQLQTLSNPNVLDSIGIVQLQMPGASQLQTWSFSDPLIEGTENFPPPLQDPQISSRLITWIKMSLNPVSATSSAVPALRLSWIGINAARVYQAVSVVNEFLGVGSGEPNQQFNLTNTPVLPQSVTVTVQDPVSGVNSFWRPIDDLLAASGAVAVFSVDAEAGLISFGDGLQGARPSSGTRILASYEYGGGRQGNVTIGAIAASRDQRLQGGYSIANPLPTSGGDQGETAADGERRIPLVLRHRDRLVTQNDFRDVTYRTTGVDVGRVEVLPLFVPTTPFVEGVPGVVTVMVAPLYDSLNPLWPLPDILFLRSVCAYLDERRLLTTEVYVRGPDYIPIYVSVGIQPLGDSFPDIVMQSVKDRLNLYLSSLPPGANGRGWLLKKAVLQKDLEAVVSRVAGVDYVDSLLLGQGAGAGVASIGFTGLQLPQLAAVQVSVGTAQSLDTLFAQAPAPAVPGSTSVPVPVFNAKC